MCLSTFLECDGIESIEIIAGFHVINAIEPGIDGKQRLEKSFYIPDVKIPLFCIRIGSRFFCNEKRNFYKIETFSRAMRSGMGIPLPENPLTIMFRVCTLTRTALSD